MKALPSICCHSVGELAEIARQAGFVDVEYRTTAGDRSVVLVRKPD